MHIPDGYLDLSIAGLFYILSIAVLGYSTYKLRGQKLTSLFGIVAAAIFAAQMLNWPIPGGTSAHFVGGALAGILLGPYAGALAMAVVLTIQCLVFADGGITALGANIWNMAIVDVFAGYYVYRALQRFNRSTAAFIAGWLGITLAAIFAGIEIGISSSFGYGLKVTVPVMGAWHALLGVVEGTITAGVVGYIAAARPDVFEQKVAPGKLALGVITAMIAVSPLFAYAAELVGYSEPLENAAAILGLEENPIYEGLLPDYTLPGLDPYVGTLIAGAVGTVIVLGLGVILTRYARTA
ncbi:MAG: energy-coupling factor ABC transporter permease [Archaeoglobus sp.]|uniref:energy-coupling factor ABC transporter permease n=1 Tax=Archaeoglobus sp. TaxID=1872626 RepID=UPI001D769B90|nr:energy-coupling factor ABC transporter permease [Archaeoglobus sp.]MBO8181043.1 energy-coupling factor ABC transporter permease [Archaeoglobus sp.]